MADVIHVYTDGSCLGNPGVGGWGVWMRYGEHEKSLLGADADTTNNRMELTAVIEALRALKRRDIPVIIYTDSTYVQRGVTEWLDGWRADNWRLAEKKRIKNLDLWRTLDALRADKTIEWQWVRGHAGDPGNERADELARTAAAQLQGVR